MARQHCGQCGKSAKLCDFCHNCASHCFCRSQPELFDADELGLDPETDNSPQEKNRHA